jgi:antitoxin component of RelBE/YafQ-DinJ toxin-antitoxin module
MTISDDTSNKESARSQCVSLRLDPTTLEEIEEEVIKNKGVTLSAAMNQKLNDGFKLIMETAKNGEITND